MEKEGEGGSIEKFTSLIGLLIDYLTLAVEREERVAAEEELFEDETRQHEEQYPGNEMEVWFHTEEFILKWM